MIPRSSLGIPGPLSSTRMVTPGAFNEGWLAKNRIRTRGLGFFVKGDPGLGKLTYLNALSRTFETASCKDLGDAKTPGNPSPSSITSKTIPFSNPMARNAAMMGSRISTTKVISISKSPTTVLVDDDGADDDSTSSLEGDVTVAASYSSRSMDSLLEEGSFGCCDELLVRRFLCCGLADGEYDVNSVIVPLLPSAGSDEEKEVNLVAPFLLLSLVNSKVSASHGNAVSVRLGVGFVVVDKGIFVLRSLQSTISLLVGGAGLSR